MAFTLTINFMGLCLFVPDQPAAGSTSVLMPSVSPSLSGSIPPHVAMLAVDLAHLQPGSAAPTGQYTLLSLESAELSFGGVGTPSTALPYIPAEITNVGEVLRRPIRHDVLGPDPSSYLNARIVLDSGSCAAMQTDCWVYPPLTPERSLAQGAMWTITEVDADHLELSPAAFGVATAPLIPALYPIVQTPAGQPPVSTLDLVICNTAVYELPIMPLALQQSEAGTPGSHFPAFYALFEMDVEAGPRPPHPCTSHRDDRRDHIFGELPYTCMGPAQSVPNPT